MVLDPQSNRGILLSTHCDTATYSMEIKPWAGHLSVPNHWQCSTGGPCARASCWWSIRGRRFLQQGLFFPPSSSPQGLPLSLLFMSDHSKQWSTLRDSHLLTSRQGQQVWVFMALMDYAMFSILPHAVAFQPLQLKTNKQQPLITLTPAWQCREKKKCIYSWADMQANNRL